MNTLFLAYLGGRVPGTHIEMHDVRFVVGESIEDTIPELKKQWFGDKSAVHLDAYMAIKHIGGFAISVQDVPYQGEHQLYFVNMGGYHPQRLHELHQFGVFVATHAEHAKQQAKTQLLMGMEHRHKDDLFQVDDCMPVSLIEPHLHIHLTHSGHNQAQVPDWFGYRPL